MHRWWITPALLATIAIVPTNRLPSQAAPSASSDAPVLFICEHGTVKSLLAKLLFEKYAADAGLHIRAISRGSAVESAVPGWMQAYLLADSLRLGSFTPQALAASDLRDARYVEIGRAHV